MRLCVLQCSEVRKIDVLRALGVDEPRETCHDKKISTCVPLIVLLQFRQIRLIGLCGRTSGRLLLKEQVANHFGQIDFDLVLSQNRCCTDKNI